MKNLVVTLGITGSGKSTWLNNKNPVVETDDLRIELLNNIDDISQERLIFNTAAKRISKLFGAYDTVYFGATLVDSKYRISFLQSIKNMCKHEFVIDMVIFSCLPKVAKERITKDLKDQKKRADSIKYIDDQYEQYLHTMNILDDEKYFYRMIQKRE
jgi:predicted kinase